jgi:copper(I)-binding protein
MTTRIVLLALAGLAALSPAVMAAEAAMPTIIAPWARATPAGAKVGAAYVTIQGAPGAADALVSASSPNAGRAELHTHIMNGAVMEMRRVERIAVPAGGRAELKPGGDHLMLMDLAAPLVAGSRIKLQLSFEKAGRVDVDVPVIAIGAQPPQGAAAPASGGHNHHHH